MPEASYHRARIFVLILTVIAWLGAIAGLAMIIWRLA